MLFLMTPAHTRHQIHNDFAFKDASLLSVLSNKLYFSYDLCIEPYTRVDIRRLEGSNKQDNERRKVWEYCFKSK